MAVLLSLALLYALFPRSDGGKLGTAPFQPTKEPTPPPRAVLEVAESVRGTEWVRDPATDLPDCQSEVAYSVYNAGNAIASDVTVSVTVDGRSYGTTTVPSIVASESYGASLTVATSYNARSLVVISASCADSSDSYSFSVGSDFPSSPYEPTGTLAPTIAELMVTPNERTVRAMKEEILKDKFFLNPDWTALWEWVGSNVEYLEEDTSTYHWQFPKDTLSSGYGMCADYSTLLVSLYRAGVFGPNDCYVVCGTNQAGRGHAWVIVRLPLVGWYSLDPQEDGNFLVNLVQNPFVVSGYTGRIQFNDQQFKVLT